METSSIAYQTYFLSQHVSIHQISCQHTTHPTGQETQSPECLGGLWFDTKWIQASMAGKYQSTPCNSGHDYGHCTEYAWNHLASPGQGSQLLDSVGCVPCTSQVCPPCSGAGLSQFWCLLSVPPVWHVPEHPAQPLQDPHIPFTVTECCWQ